MIIEISFNQLIITALTSLILLLFLYIYFSNKAKKKAKKKFNNKKQELEESIKKEYKLKFNEWKKEHEELIRKDAAKRSDLTLTGKVAENLAPLTKKFKHDLESMRYLGDPIDYIAFDNYGEKQETKIYLIEIKSGNSRLTKKQRNLKYTVKEGRVYWETIRID